MESLISYLFILYENGISFDIAAKILLYGGVPTIEEMQELNPEMDVVTLTALKFWFDICNKKMEELGLLTNEKFVSMISILNNTLSKSYDNSVDMSEAVLKLYKSESYRLN